MPNFLLILTAAGAIASISPVAVAMPVAPVTNLKTHAVFGPLEPVVYICKQRYWSGKRYCYWRPSGYHWHWRWRLWR